MTTLNLRRLLARKRDGGWGWVVVVAVVCSQMVLGGICLSGGIFYVIFRNALGSSPMETSWLCSLPITFWMISSPIGSFLTNKYGYRACAFIGGVIAATGLSIGYFATNIVFLLFSHGILTGLGFGISYTGCMAAINVYFDKYKTVATGFASIGLNAGLIIYARLMLYLDNEYGWRGALLILGAIAFNLCLFAAVLAPLNVKVVRQSDTGKSLTEQTHVTKQVELDNLIITTKDDPEIKVKAVKKKNLNFGVFKKPSFVCFCLSNVLLNTAQGIYILHLPSYATLIGFSKDDIGTVLMVWGLTNIVGKVIYSLLGQHPRVDVTVVYGVSLTATGLCMGLTPVFLTRTGMFVLPAFVGFFFCVTGALLPAVIFRIVGYERFADGVGLSSPFRATGNLIGGPLAGYLFSVTGDYSSSFYLAGICMVIGSLFLIQPVLYHKRTKRNKKRGTNLNIVYQLECIEPSHLSVSKHSIDTELESFILHENSPT